MPSRFSRTIVLIGLTVAWLAGGAAALSAARDGNPEAAKLKNPAAATPESVAAGEKTFQRYCRGCHGRDAKGGPGSETGPAAPDLTDEKWEHGSTDGEIFWVIQNGVPPDLKMEPYGDRLKDPDIWNVVNYLRSLAAQK